MSFHEIKGLHHVTSMAQDARKNNAFFTRVLGLRRVKKTVNFDAPDVYHLYYGDETGTPGSVMTYFPFPHIGSGQRGVGEVGRTAFSVPQGSLDFWQERLVAHHVSSIKRDASFGQERLTFEGPDKDQFALVEVADDSRIAWAGGDVDTDVAIRGFHSVTARLTDPGGMSELLGFMGYEKIDGYGDVTRFSLPNGRGNGADLVDIETVPTADKAQQGAGSVHHIAFAVEDRAAQLRVREKLLDTGYQVTPVIDRDYFWAIYFRTPGGILFEIATNEPGFHRDEELENLGSSLRLPRQHEHLRAQLANHLPSLDD